jgi:hypothetical protein
VTRLLATTLLLCASCYHDAALPSVHPAQFEAGLNTRHYVPPAPEAAFRAQEGTSSTSTGESGGAAGGSAATTGAFRFTMSTPLGSYLGGEAEFGTLGTPGTNVAGGYGVLGLRRGNTFATASLEIAAGWRSIRYGLDKPDVDKLIAEPRLRGDLWLNPQISLGLAVGATLGERVWMAGIYLGFHSHDFDGNDPR